MKSYFEPSISAYKLLNRVTKTLQIDEAPETSVQNGNALKIISLCNSIIEAKYEHRRTRELLKYYVAHSFFEDYDLESDDDYSDQILN